MPSDLNSMMTLGSEQELEAEPRSSVFPGKELGQLSICRREGGWGEWGRGAGFPPPLHPWPLASWALTWPAGALQPAKVTLSFSSPPILGAGRWAGCKENGMAPILPRSSGTLKELNGRENRSYCLFRFVFTKYKKTPEPMVWTTPAT